MNATGSNATRCVGRTMPSEVHTQLIQDHACLREALSIMKFGTNSGVYIQEKGVPAKDSSMEKRTQCAGSDKGERSFG